MRKPKRMELSSKRNRENNSVRNNGIGSGSASNLESSRQDEGSNSRASHVVEAEASAPQTPPGKTTVRLRVRQPLPATRIENPKIKPEVACMGGSKTPITGMVPPPKEIWTNPTGQLLGGCIEGVLSKELLKCNAIEWHCVQ